LSDFLSVHNVAFTIFGYPMSWVELCGTLLYLWSVWLITRRRILTWPVGIVSVLLYMVLFYQIRLYADALEQVYYLAASVYGWWRWSQLPKEGGAVTGVHFGSLRSVLFWLVLTIVVGLATGALLARIHSFFPTLFPEAASYPYVDALTTIASFTAMWLMARQRIESWCYWIVIDVLGIGLYYVKAVRFVSLLYVVLLVLAIKGLLGWINSETPATPLTHASPHP
jgi:nicotinamide mononucleotide transporter